jgi:serine protease
VIEISAPGGDKNINGSASSILSTLNAGTTTPGADSYVSYQGTSMATPHVAGLVSLLFAVDPTLTPAQVTTLLQSNVTAFPVGSSCSTANCGPGIINAAAAVAAAQGAGSNPPGTFLKSAPATGTTLSSTSTTLRWGSSVGATSYAYCFDTTNDNACSNWTNTGTSTSATIAGLVAGNSYFWQVQAQNSNGTTVAGDGWWRFSVPAGAAPAAFNKTSPSNGGTGGRTSATLRWKSSSGATSYEVCLDTSNDGSCDGSWQRVSGTRVSVSSLARRTTYYWQVRANNANGTTLANGGTWWRFTTR